MKKQKVLCRRKSIDGERCLGDGYVNVLNRAYWNSKIVCQKCFKKLKHIQTHPTKFIRIPVIHDK